MTIKSRATIEDLYKVPDNGKAEIVIGELVVLSPTGDMPGYAADELYEFGHFINPSIHWLPVSLLCEA